MLQIKTVTSYMDVVGLFYKKLINTTHSDFQKIWYEEELHNLKAAYYIQRNFNIKTKIDDLSNRNLKKSLLNKLIESTVEEIEYNTSVDVIKQCQKFAYLLEYSTDDIFIELAKKITNSEALYDIFENIYLKESSVKNMCLAVIIIIRNLGITDSVYNILDCSGNATLSIPQNDNTEFCRKSLKLAFNIIRKTLNQQKVEEEYGANVELLNWLLSMYHLIQSKESIVQGTLSCRKFYSLTTPSSSSFNSVREIFECSSLLIGIKNIFR